MLSEYQFSTRPNYTYMQWLVSKEPVLPCDSHVTVGVVLDSDHAFSVLDMGPAADSKQVSQYFIKFLCNIQYLVPFLLLVLIAVYTINM